MIKDSHSRSLTKAVTWRMTGTIDTIVISFFITGHWGTALSIGGTEVFTKIILFYFHERIWNTIPLGRKASGPAYYRSFIKSFSWRFAGTLDTIIISYFFSGNITMAVTIGSIEVATKVVLYFFHERVWSKISWGRVYSANTKLNSSEVPVQQK